MPAPAKLAQTTAQRIESDILNEQLPVGHRLGTEADLLARYGVSRAVLREAIRIVERHQLGETRRGTGGGLFVAQPAREAVARVLCGYLSSLGLELSELFEARRFLEAVTTRYAAERIDSEGARELLKLVAARERGRFGSDDLALHEQFHTKLAELARSPALALFVQALHQISQDVGLALVPRTADTAEQRAAVWQAKRRIARAIVDGDATLAQRLINDHLLEREAFLRRQRPRRRSRSAERAGEKRAESLARELTEQIRRRNCRPGTRIGSERELIEKYGISRAIFREAVRMLEQHAVAGMRRGSGGGLFVYEPDPSAVVRSASVYLAHLGLDARSVQEAREALEPAAAYLAAERAQAEDLGRLSAALGRVLSCDGAELGAAARSLHERIADLCGNRAMSLFIRVVITASWGDASAAPPALPPGWEDELRRNQMRIVAAIDHGDRALARTAMLEHLQLTTGWWVAAKPPRRKPR